MDLFEGLREKLDFVNQAIRDLDLSKVHPIIEIPINYAIQGGGKRLRPVICMLCAEVVGGDYKETKNAFMALELIHNGTLVHDDIIDEDLFRRGSPSVQVKFDSKRAVLTGDALLSLGLQYATKTGKLGIVDRLAETALSMVQGVALQTFFRRKMVSEATYLNINYLKSGSLFECAAVLGSLIGSENPEDAVILAEFGRNFGDAYQIRDDICSIFAEDRHDDLSRVDLLNGDVSLLLIYSLDSESISNEDRNTLMMLHLGQKESLDIHEIQRIYEEAGALERSITLMKSFAEKGRECLKRFRDSDARAILYNLLDLYYSKFNPKVKPEILL
ncbi:MAG: polyprenyl synthetase family protein [Candidatus Bathyarchaeota archaeon]|nr:MAG: polyprenyl synthetase family protein [Candidatus Bathyarchaeota archaeon]